MVPRVNLSKMLAYCFPVDERKQRFSNRIMSYTTQHMPYGISIVLAFLCGLVMCRRVFLNLYFEKYLDMCVQGLGFVAAVKEQTNIHL